MKTTKTAFLILILSATMLNAQAQNMRIAILDLESGSGVDEALAKDTADLIRGDMISLNMFTVLERGQMKEILKEQEFSLTGCVDTSCAVKIGQLLSANKILIGKISKFGKTYTINIRIVDVEKGVGEFAEKITAGSQDEIPNKVTSLVKKLSEKIAEQKPAYDPGVDPTTEWGKFNITVGEWREYKSSGLSMQEYIIENRKNNLTGSFLALIPLYSGFYYTEKSCYFHWGNLFTALDAMGLAYMVRDDGTETKEEKQQNLMTGLIVWGCSSIIDIIVTNIIISKKNRTIRKFEKFSLKAGIDNKNPNFSLAYRF